MRDSKHWPIRALRRTYLVVLSTGVAALVVAGLSLPNGYIWW
jgi:hypothetical protein